MVRGGAAPLSGRFAYVFVKICMPVFSAQQGFYMLYNLCVRVPYQSDSLVYLNITDEGICALSFVGHQNMFAFQVVKHESKLCSLMRS